MYVHVIAFLPTPLTFLSVAGICIKTAAFGIYAMNYSNFNLCAMRSDRSLHLSMLQLCSHVDLKDNSYINAYSIN